MEFKNLFRRSATYGISIVAARGLGLITAPILTRIFEPSDYGKIALVQIALAFAVIIAGSNIGSGVTYFYYHYDSERVRRNVLSSGLTVVITLALFVAVAFYMAAEPIDHLMNKTSSGIARELRLSTLLQIGSLSIFFGVIKTSFQTILRINEQPKKYIKVELLSLCITFLLTLLLVVHFRVGIVGVFWAAVGGSFCGMLLATFYVRHLVGRSVSLALVIPIVAYALPQMPGALITWVQSQTGRVFINYFASLTEQGLFSIALAIAAVVAAVGGAFRLAYDPYSLSVMKQPDAPKIYASVAVGYTFAFGLLVSAISSFAKPILIILTPPAYHDAQGLIIWLLAAVFLTGHSNIIGVGIWITRKTKYTSYAAALTFMSVTGFSFLLVPIYGALGAAVALFLGATTQSLAYFAFAQKLYYVPYQFVRTNLVVICLIILGVGNSIIVEDLDLLAAVGTGCLTFLLSFMVVFYSALSKSQRQTGVLFGFNFIRKKLSWCF